MIGIRLTQRPLYRLNGVVIGNVYNKYRTRNPIASRLMNGFLLAVEGFYLGVKAKTVLEVGCGEGLLSNHLYKAGPPPVRFEACDLALEQIAPEIEAAIRFRTASIYQLPYAENEFDLVVCCEVLEHLHNPHLAMSELSRVAHHAVLLSTPREPLWRILNVCRGRYLGRFGDTPGHVQHYSHRGLISLASLYLDIRRLSSPTPWTVLLGEPRS